MRRTITRSFARTLLFAVQSIDAAMDAYVDTLEREIDRRAFQGVEKPVFYQGKRVDTVKKILDPLAMFRAPWLRVPGSLAEVTASVAWI